jgi:hypothetical protein
MTTQPKPPAKKPRFSRRTLILGVIALLFICGLIGTFLNPGPDSIDTSLTADSATAAAFLDREPTPEPAAPTTAHDPTTEPTADPPADPIEALRATIDQTLGESNRDLGRKLNLFDVEAVEGSLLLGWAADDNFSADLIRGGMQLDTVEVLKAIDESGIPYDWVYIGSTFAMQDQFGNASEMEVLTLAYSAETLDRINWDNFIFSNVFDIADTFVLHPEFQGD